MASVQGLSAGNYLNGRIDINNWLNNANGVNTNSLYDTNEIQANSDGFEKQSEETCTDGKDDGKIGLFSKIGHAIKGVGKSIKNGIKGMFTNKEGKFSLGKTLLSAATIAACVAFPAVGVGLCAVGAVSGAVQVGKGIAAASKATTDAEAKEAWQNIGGGTFTVAASVVGAKAGVKAMKATSTAGGEISALDALKSTGTKATKAQVAKAFIQDAKSSTVNGWTNIKNSAPAQTLADGTTNFKMNVKKFGVKETAKTYGKALVDDAKNLGSKGWESAKATAKNVKSAGIKGNYTAAKTAIGNGINTLKGAPKAAAEFLTTGEGTYAEAVQQFGYANVAEALKVVGAAELGQNN